MKRPNRLFTRGGILAFWILFLLAAVVPAWGGTASPGRMAYVNGQIHRIWIHANYDYMYHQAGLPADPVNGTGDFVAVKDDVGNTVPADRGPYICRYKTLASNEGLAVFNNKIFVVYTKETSCGNFGSMAAYVATFDLLGTPEYPHGRWTTIDYKLGPVGYKSASGAAITVFNGQLYAFTDSDTYTSGDGVNWTVHNHPLNDVNHEPLDAVTIYPQNAPPQILLVYGGSSCTSCNYFQNIYAATWNGDFNTARQDYAGNCSGAPSGCISGNPIVGADSSTHDVEGRVSLLPGTKNASSISGSLPGDKVPAVQLFAQQHATNTWLRNLEYHVEDRNWYKKDKDYNGCTGLMVYPWYVSACDNSSYSTRIHQARHQRFVALGCGTPIPSFDSDYLVPQNHETTTGCDSADGVMNSTSPGTELTRKYWSLIGVVLGSPPFSFNRVTEAATVEKISNVMYGTKNTGSTTHYQEWTHQDMISTGLEVHAGLFDDLLKITNSFDSTYKHDWESQHQTILDHALALENTMGTGTYAEDVFQPVPYSSCTTNADCEQYADPYVMDNDPACQIYVAGEEPAWRECQTGDTGCVCTESHYGKLGWALFNAPNLYVQDYAVHAYDYDYHTGSGTNLNQDLHTVLAKGFSVKPVTFDLQHPELVGQIRNPDGSIKPDSGILHGMQPFPYSTDFEGWNQQIWDLGDHPWWIKLGPSTNPSASAVTHDTGFNNGMTFTESTMTVDSSVQTTANEIKNDTEVEVGTGLSGFKANLTVGRKSSFSSSVTTETAFENDVTADFKMPDCTAGLKGCVTSLTTQPYLLVATGKAPWIPDLYPVQEGKDGPWCITWTVTNWCPGGPACNLATSLHVSATGLPPRNASGRIVGGNGGGERGADRYSHYSIEGGRLAWADSNGSEERIPMTADEFVPAKGVTIDINGRSWSSSGSGSWQRSGSIWTFQTDSKVQENRVLLRLDFNSATYDLQLQKVNFEGHVFAGMKDLVVRLDVNGEYAFSTIIHHDVDITWRWSQPPADNLTMHVTSFQGRYNSANQSGKVSIEGTLPEELPAFGDVAMVINGEKMNIPLISQDDFQQAVEMGGVFNYVKKGLNLWLDFGDKTWSATFNNQAFRRLLAPRWGTISAKILVGGLPQVSREAGVLDYSANLTFQR